MKMKRPQRDVARVFFRPRWFRDPEVQLKRATVTLGAELRSSTDDSFSASLLRRKIG
jgi:hypothetical protein